MERVFEMRMEIDMCEDQDELFAIQVDIQTQFADKIKEIAALFR